MIVPDHFRFCPRCAAPREQSIDPGPFRCRACNFVFFFNPASAAAAFIVRDDGSVLFVRRAVDPAKGKLGLPGGFIDFDETAEAAVHREVQEELGIKLGSLTYLCSQTNRYPYLGVTYQVLDFFFLAQIDPAAQPAPLDGVQSFEWLKPREIIAEDIAFISVRRALACYVAARPDNS